MNELDEVVAVMQAALSKFLGLEVPQALQDAVTHANPERVQRNATAAVLRYVEASKCSDTKSQS